MIARLREDRDLRQRLRTAEHMATVGQFARNIAHEIKNPLNFISLSVDHMRDVYRPADGETAARYESLIDNIKGEVARISRFAESFLEYGRPFELAPPALRSQHSARRGARTGGGTGCGRSGPDPS